MLNTKFYDYTQGMSAYELNRFRKYLQSPLLNEDEKLCRLVDALLPFIKANNWNDVKKEEIWKHVFGKASYNHAKYIRLLSDTVKKLEDFLVMDRFRQNHLLRREYLLEIMNERKLARHFPEALSLAVKKQQQQPWRDGTFYLHHLHLQQQQNAYLENKDQRSVEKNLQDVVHGLDTFYFIEKLKYCAALLHYKNFLDIKAEVPLLDEILNHLQQTPANIPAIEIYRRIILSFREPDNEKHYEQLKELIVNNSHTFVRDELKSMFVFAMNYCINQINFGKAGYLKEILTLYKYALQNNLLLEDGYLSQWDYKNIVTTALRVKELKWAEHFISEYRHQLPAADRDNAYTFNMARYFFYTKKYDRVLQLLQDVKYNDIFYQLDSKTTLLKTYFELGEWMPMYSLKDSFRILLRRKRLITPQQKENYMNLLKLSIRLYRVDVKNKAALKALKKEIEQTPNVADKSWLMEKVGELG